jgi:hypothetical protein
MNRFGGGNPFSALWFNLQQALPGNVTSLFGLGILLSWPLLLGRMLTSPLPFFRCCLTSCRAASPIVDRCCTVARLGVGGSSVGQ